MRRILAAAAVLAALTVGPPPARAATSTVTMKGLEFQPRIAHVSLGDTVTWANGASDRHTTTSEGPTPWDSGRLGSWGGRFSHIFAVVGSFPYYCTIHKSVGMRGTIAVALKVSPTVGTRSTNYVVTLAKTGTKPPAGFSYVLQKALGAGAYTNAIVTTNATATFHPASSGTYRLRAGLQKTTGAPNEAWFSEPITVKVS